MGGAAAIELSVERVDQLFDMLDPSPIGERDLARHAAEFIEFSYREAEPPKPGEVRVHVPPALGPEGREAVPRAVHQYFIRSRDAERLGLREHNRRSRWLLLVALGVMTGCLSLRAMLLGWLGPERMPQVLDEGLIILGWVALWRPLEELLYEWHPRWRRVRLYDQLARLAVSVVQEPR